MSENPLYYVVYVAGTLVRRVGIGLGRHSIDRNTFALAEYPDETEFGVIDVTAKRLAFQNLSSWCSIRSGSVRMLAPGETIELGPSDVLKFDTPTACSVIITSAINPATSSSLSLSTASPALTSSEGSLLSVSSPLSPLSSSPVNSSLSSLPLRAQELIDQLGLMPHPEGGYYRRIHQSSSSVQPQDGRSSRFSLTSIYYLLVSGQISRWHSVASDETWHLYEGGPLQLLLLPPEEQQQQNGKDGYQNGKDRPQNGKTETEKSKSILRLTLRNPVAAGQGPQHTVPSHWWQAAVPLGEYALVGCTVGPGFDFADFKLLSGEKEAREKILSRCPEAQPYV